MRIILWHVQTLGMESHCSMVGLHPHERGNDPQVFPRVRSRDCLLNVLVGSSLHICFRVILVCSQDGGHSKVHGNVCLQGSLDSESPRPGLALCTLGDCIQGVDGLGIKPVFTSTAVSQIWGL